MKWKCSVCTLENDPARTICAVCQTPRAAAPKASAAAAPKPKARPARVVGEPWQCPRCTFENRPTAARCNACQAAKPKLTKPKASSAAASGRGGSGATAAAAKKKKKKKPPQQQQQQTSTTTTTTTTTRPARRGSSKKKNRVADDVVNSMRAMGITVSKADAEDALRKNGNSKVRAIEQLIATSTSKKRSSSASASASASSSSAAASSASSSSSSSSSSIAKKKTSTTRKRSKAEQRAAEQRKKKREALERKLREEEQNRLEQERQAELAERQAIAEELKRKQEEAERRKKLERIEKERAEKRKLREAERERREKRAAKERKLKSVEQAIEYMVANYDSHRVEATCALLRKVCLNIVQHPKEAKYRSIGLTSQRAQVALVRPIGAQVILRLLGFRADADGSHMVLASGAMDVRRLKSAAEKLGRVLKQRATELPAMIAKSEELLEARCRKRVARQLADGNGDDNKDDEAALLKKERVRAQEHLYYGLMELKKVVSNVVALPTSRNFCSIDMSDKVYEARLKSVPHMLKMLQYLGFAPNNNGYLVVEKPNVSLFEASLRDVSQALAARGSSTRIFRALSKIVSRATTKEQWGMLVSFIELLDGSLERIVDTPHEQKFHKLNVKAVFKRVGGVVPDGARFLTLLGFVLNADHTRAHVPYPDGFDVDLIAKKRVELNRAWQVLSAAHRTANRDHGFSVFA